MLKKAKVHIYTLDDHEGYICIDVDGVALYEHFIRGDNRRTSFTTHMSGFSSLIKAVEGLRGGCKPKQLHFTTNWQHTYRRSQRREIESYRSRTRTCSY